LTLAFSSARGTSLLAAAVDPDAFATTAIVVLAFYLVLLLVLGWIGWRRSRSNEEDYYLAGRQQGWIVSALTIMATFFSSFALLGAPAMVYREGVAFALFALNVPVGAMIVYIVGSRIARHGRKHGYVTQADMIAQHYGSPVAMRLLVALIGFLYAVPYIVMQLNAGGIITETIFPNAKDAFTIGTSCLAVITMLYIMVGGMRSVAWTDVIQGVLLVGGMFLAGAAAIGALGGPSGFLDAVSKLPEKSLSLPGTTGSWTPWKLLTIVTFAAFASMIQPAQWMRYYAARSTNTLRRSALIFGTVLPAGFLFGVMLVGLGGQALYPIIVEGDTVLPHPEVGETARHFDNILMVVLKDHLPGLVGPLLGTLLAAVVGVAIMAAAMSTADSNLHATSAVFTRDIYDRFVRPGASDKERTFVGRLTIAAATLISLAVIWLSKESDHFNPIKLIAEMGFVAMAFACQLIPVTVDVLFVRRGTRAGAICGMVTGIAVVFLFTPFYSMIVGDTAESVSVIRAINRTVDSGFFAVVFNVLVFAVVSALTKQPRDAGQAT